MKQDSFVQFEHQLANHFTLKRKLLCLSSEVI